MEKEHIAVSSRSHTRSIYLSNRVDRVCSAHVLRRRNWVLTLDEVEDQDLFEDVGAILVFQKGSHKARGLCTGRLAPAKDRNKIISF